MARRLDQAHPELPRRLVAPPSFRIDPRFLPMTRAEMDARGWDAVDVVFVTGDAYVDHYSFAMAVLGRVLEKEGFRVAVLSQPDWRSAEPWKPRTPPRPPKSKLLLSRQICSDFLFYL